MSSMDTTSETEATATTSPEQLGLEAKEAGNVLYKQAQYSKAVEQYSKAIEYQPNEASYYNNRSAAYLMLQKFAEALTDVETAIRLDGTNAKYFVRSAKCNLQLGKLNDVDRAIASARAIDPSVNVQQESQGLTHVRTYLNNAQAALDNAQYNLVVSTLDRCLQICPGATDFMCKKAEAYIHLKQYGEASIITTTILQKDGTHVGAWYVRGLCAYYQGENEKCIDFFQRALRNDPDHSLSRVALKRTREIASLKEQGNTAFNAGRNQEALEFYTKALAVDPLNVNVNSKLYYNRALVSSKLKQSLSAVQDCSKALELDPAYHKALLKRARLYLELEKYEEAVQDFDAASKADPSNSDVRRELRNAQLELKKSKRKDYYKILELSKDADEEAIRKSYKKQALKWHPDRIATGTEEEKAEYDRKFKDIGEAYKILSDPQAKARYDSGQDLEEEGGMSHSNVDVQNIFASMFGGGHPGFSFGGGFPGGFGGGFPGGSRRGRGHGHAHNPYEDDDW